MTAGSTAFFVNKHELSDEIDLLQLGQADEIEFVTITHGKGGKSAAKNWPTKEKRELFKLNSALFSLS